MNHVSFWVSFKSLDYSVIYDSRRSFLGTCVSPGVHERPKMSVGYAEDGSEARGRPGEGLCWLLPRSSSDRWPKSSGCSEADLQASQTGPIPSQLTKLIFDWPKKTLLRCGLMPGAASPGYPSAWSLKVVIASEKFYVLIDTNHARDRTALSLRPPTSRIQLLVFLVILAPYIILYTLLLFMASVRYIYLTATFIGQDFLPTSHIWKAFYVFFSHFFINQ